jgi:hypothetical protein
MISSTPTCSNHVPRVSIGVPVYNGEKYLASALDSILAQSFTDFEVIISDNASTDRTEQICREYAARDNRIRYVRQPQNRGMTWNFSHTVELARGEYFRWHAHDDSCASTLLQRCVEALDRNPDAVLAYPRVEMIDCNGEPLPDDPSTWRPPQSADGTRTIDERDPRGLDSPQASRRYYGVLMKTIWCLEPYGVMRTAVMHTTGKLRSYRAAEKVFIAEMALRGQLIEVPEKLLHVRRHDDQYSLVDTASGQQSFVTPGAAAKRPRFKLRLPVPRHVRSTWGFFLLIPSAPISFVQRMRCLGVLARYVLQVSKWKRIVVNTLRDTGMTDGYKHVLQTKRPVQSSALHEQRDPVQEQPHSLPESTPIREPRESATANSAG